MLMESSREYLLETLDIFKHFAIILLFQPIQRLRPKTQISEDFLNIFFLLLPRAIFKTIDYLGGFNIFIWKIFYLVWRLYPKIQITEDSLLFYVNPLFGWFMSTLLIISSIFGMIEWVIPNDGYFEILDW